MSIVHMTAASSGGLTDEQRAEVRERLGGDAADISIPVLIARLIEALLHERDAYREAAEWLVKEGGWRVTYYDVGGPRPAAIEQSRSISPRVKRPEEFKA